MQYFKSLASQQKTANRNISELFDDTERAQDFSIKAAGLLLDYSKQNISRYELSKLLAWTEDQRLSQRIKSIFSGEKINVTENRAVLHSVLRAPAIIKHKVLGEAAIEVEKTERQMAKIVDGVIQGLITSSTGEKFTDVLAIGIGGSYYGVKVTLSALAPYHCTGLNVHV